ncbi:TPA: AlpA family phage regulatory protein [Klebsiella quasipneumoniae]|nr:AlpA family phage regulatory protein [Klebsiella quasipneumoniae]
MSTKTKTIPHHENQLPKTGYIRMFKVAPALGISVSTAYRWVEQGKLPKPIKLSDRVTVFDAVELNVWLENRGGVA